MSEIRYIHAADLHLDTPFAGLARENADGELAKILREAPYMALERLLHLCESQRPHFLVLAGDIYDNGQASIKAQLKLREACGRLDDLGIQVYIAHGNHDPLSSRLQSLKFPPNTRIFSADKVETFTFQTEDGSRALIHGISHGQDREARNLALLFTKKPDDAFQLGVLHCSVENAAQADRYAPCSLNDLKNVGLDAWALGHVHERRIICEAPFIAYPGNTQGLHINEQESRGCLLVRARSQGGSWHCESEFHTLGPVQWQKACLDLDGAADPAQLEERLARLVEERQEEADPSASALIQRLAITGRTALNGWLRKEGRLEDLQAMIAHHSASRPMIFLKDLELATLDEESWEESMTRADLLGETLRVYSRLAKNPTELHELLEKTLKPLAGRPGSEAFLQEADEDKLSELLYQAQKTCLDVLEGR